MNTCLPPGIAAAQKLQTLAESSRTTTRLHVTIIQSNQGETYK